MQLLALALLAVALLAPGTVAQDTAKAHFDRAVQLETIENLEGVIAEFRDAG
jgi:hypothetical protein